MKRKAAWLALGVVAAGGLWWWLRGGFLRAPRSLERLALESAPLDPLERQLRVVQRFAPVFVQKRKPKRTRTDNGEAYEDHFVRVDYDGDWSGFNNSANLNEAERQGRDLTAHVYYGVQETDAYYYLHFVYFHPRDPKWFGPHENDLEGGMVVVRKDPVWEEQLERTKLVLVQAQAHNRFDYETADGLCVTGVADPIGGAECKESRDDAKTHPILVSQAGRGLPWSHGHGTEIPREKKDLPATAFVYVPGEVAEKPAIPPRGPVAYRLVSLTGDRDGDGELDIDRRTGRESPPGLWDRRLDDRIYGQAAPYALLDGERIGHGLQSGDGCKANTPWGWHGKESNVPKGTFFLDPAHGPARKILARHGVEEPPRASYVSNVYVDPSRIQGTFTTQATEFRCDCDHMMVAFASATAQGLHTLPAGGGCPRAVEVEAVPATARRLSRTRWSTCEELEEWIHPEEGEAFEQVGPPSDGSCYLTVREGAYLTLPREAEGVPLAEASRLPRLFRPESDSALRVVARASGGSPGFDVGGFWLHRGGTYDESMATVPFFARKRLEPGAWQEVFLSFATSPHFRKGEDVVLLALGADVAARFAIAATEEEAAATGGIEIDTIELTRIQERSLPDSARAPLTITAIEPREVGFGEQVTIRGEGFATEQCALNFVTFGDQILKVVGCTASSLIVEANAVGEATLRVSSAGGRGAESREKLAIRVEP